MAFKKIHRRADIAPNAHKRQLPGLGTSSSRPAAASTTQEWHGAITPPSGPLYSTSGSSRSTTSGSTSSTSGSQTSSVSTSSAPTQTQQNAPTSTQRVSSTADGPSSRSTISRIVSVTSRPSASTSAASTESDGMSVASMAGIAAAVIVAIGVVSIFVVWLLRRKRKNHDIDQVPFNRNSYLRHSTIIADDDSHLPSRTRPTPGPDMSERQPTPMYGGAPTFTDMNQNSFGYSTQPSYQPGQVYGANAFGPGGAPATPLPHSPGFGTTYDPHGYNGGGYTELTRGGPHDYPPSPQYPHSPYGQESFSGPERGPDVVNHKQVNYPELSPAPAAQQGHVVVGNSSVHDGRETPVQLGFVPAQTRQPGLPGGHGHAKRPDTVYDNEDAYGGM